MKRKLQEGVERKAVVAEFKAGDEPGVFEALFSRFGNVDRYGDRVLPGAFEDVFKGDLPPVVWTHLWDVPPIGVTLEAVETDDGASAKGRLFVADGEDHEIARQVNTAMKGGALRQFSYAYTVATGGWEYVEEDGQTIREIAKFSEVYEWGPTLVGVNPQTELLAAPKSLAALLVETDSEDIAKRIIASGIDLGPLVDRWAADLKAGSRNSTNDLERLQSIHDLAVENGAACGEPKAANPENEKRLRELLAVRPL